MYHPVIQILIAIILVIILILSYYHLNPPKKKCKTDTDCKDKGQHCVRGTCTDMSCLEAIKQDIKDINIDPTINSCNYTPGFYRFNSTTADLQSPFGKTRIDDGTFFTSYDWFSINTYQSSCLQHKGCIGWEFDMTEPSQHGGECYFYTNPHPALKNSNDITTIMGIARNTL
ncbi:pI10L [Recombinant African swine fever virus]|nr:pI10L [Recombinant African swine fever virus]CAK8178923.1 p22-2L [African swine fever virus]CAK8179638.1 p22-2L [African swine fever virus]CAK8179920.1 p22-2L [African swine fever virus]CAK8180147.1 p22-2L [African swine fever virus]